MDRKTKQAYNDVLMYIKENIFNMDPHMFIMDYEAAMRQAVNLVYPNSKILGCW